MFGLTVKLLIPAKQTEVSMVAIMAKVRLCEVDLHGAFPEVSSLHHQ
jgi:hypothetical protein